MNVHSIKRGRPVVDDKRRRILDAALTTFAERGYHGTAVPEVAQAAKVSTGTLYHYFDSKEVLVNEVYRDAKTRLRAALLELPKLELAKHEPPKHELPKHELSKHELPKHELTKHELSKHELSKHELTKHELTKHESSKHELSKHEPYELDRGKAWFTALWNRLGELARAEPDAFRFLEMQDHAPYLDAESRALELSVLA